MKSKLFFAFAIVAAFASVLLSSCGKTSTTTTNNGCVDINGSIDTGVHKIYGANGSAYLGALVPDIRDTLSATVTSSSAVTIYDNALKQNLTGSVNCNTITLDSVLFKSGVGADTTAAGVADTLIINSATLGRVQIWGVRAGGSGTINADGTVNTQIKIKRGKTNLSVLPDLGGIWLLGTFRKSN